MDYSRCTVEHKYVQSGRNICLGAYNNNMKYMYISIPCHIAVTVILWKA